IRKYLISIGYPVIGNSRYTRPLKTSREKGLCMALTQIRFVHPFKQTVINLKIDEPKKFDKLREREKVAFQKRLEKDKKELQEGGVIDVSTYDRKTERPVAYIIGEKSFFGMRFKVSPSTLIPRPSSETLVKAVL